MKFLIVVGFMISQVSISFSQEKFDSKIILTLKDTTGIYLNTKIAMVNSDFIVKDNYNKDTLTTYTRELNKMPGYIIARAVITGNTVTFTGVYGLKRINDWGYNSLPTNYNRIIYYKGSKTWLILMDIAKKITGEINFAK
ncbi:MAG: hypothetical protein ABIN67_21885 [Ferruginibacter sp.]